MEASKNDVTTCPHCGAEFANRGEYLTHAFAIHYLTAEEA